MRLRAEMKHGDKISKTAKAASQASGKKGNDKGSDKVPVKAAAEAGKSGKAGKEAPAVKESRKAGDTGKKQQAGSVEKSGGPGAKAGGKESLPASAARPKAGVPRSGGGEDGFNNAAVANAFKRAVKKYPNAFRRLTD